MRLLRHVLAYCHATGLLWLLCLGVSQAGVLAIPDTSASRAINLTSYWSVLDTASPDLAIEEVSGAAFADAFQRADFRHEALSLGLRASPAWLKLQISNGSKRDLERYLEIGFPHIDALELYQPEGAGFQKVATGREAEFADRPFHHRHFVFPLTLEAGSEKTYYLRIHSEGPLYLPARLWKPDHFIEHSHAQYMAQALYFGMLLALGLYKLLLFFSLRDKAYLHYVLVVATTVLALLAYGGIGYQFLWPQAGQWSKVANMAAFSLACMALLSLERHLLRTPKTAPLLDKAMQAMIVLNAVQIIGLAWSYSHFLLPGAVMYLSSLGLILVVAARSFIKRQSGAGYLLLAMGFQLCIAILMTLSIFGADLPSFIALYGLQAGSAFMLLLLSMMLAARFQQERREKEVAQQKLVEGLKRSEQLLEQHVASRTSELVRSNRSLQEHQQALAIAKQVAEEASRMKSQFLANVSHEIRTPMNAVIGMAHLALRTELTAQQRDYIDKIHRSAVALLGIMNDILDFSKIEAGKMMLERTVFSLSDVINHVNNVTGQMATEKELEYLIDIAPDVPRRMIGDPLRLGQVLINLVSNALKFTQHGEVHLSCRVIGSDADSVKLQFEVRDTGIGMSAEQQKRLFQSFTQADSSISRKYGGTGLGLSISKRLVEMMGGSIMVSSMPRAGSTFSFTLRCGVVRDGEETAIRLPPELCAQRMLVVDDNPVALKIMKDMLESFGLRPDTARSGTAALEAILRADSHMPYDLVLSDLRMPGMDGIALMQELERSPLSRQPRGILVTSARKEETISLSGYASLSAILHKPLHASQLLDCLLGTVMPDDVAMHHPAVLQAHALPRFDGHRILLVEDNEINQQITHEMLAATGLRVDIANNGREALEMLFGADEHTYDLVLMDIQMPELGGHATAQRIRAADQFSQLPILALTAHATLEERELCLRSGMQDHLSKPLHPDQLYHQVGRWLKSDNAATGAHDEAAAQTAALAASVRDEHDAQALPGFDIEGTLERLGGDRALHRQVLEMMLPLLRNALEQIDSAARHDDQDAIRAVVHNIAGMAANVGAVALANAATTLESALNRQEASDADIAAFCGIVHQTMQTLERHLAA